MLENISIGQYYPAESILHRLDPRVKISILLVYVIIVFLARGFLGYMLLTGFIVAALQLSQVPYSFILRGLRPVFFIIVFTMIIHVFMTPGQVIFGAGPITATVEGVSRGIFMAWRLALLVISASLLTLTTSPIDLTDGMEYMLKPYQRFGVPAHELAMMVTIALRFVPTLLQEVTRIMRAQMARGADFESGSLLQRGRSMVPLLVPLFVSAFKRADDLALAMEARAYRGGQGRTRLKVLATGTHDWVAVAIALSFAAVVTYTRFAMF